MIFSFIVAISIIAGIVFAVISNTDRKTQALSVVWSQDENGNRISVGAGVAVKDDTDNVVVFADIAVFAEEAESYVMSSPDSDTGYFLTLYQMDDAVGLCIFGLADETVDQSKVSLLGRGTCEEGDAARIVYFGDDFKENSLKIEITEIVQMEENWYLGYSLSGGKEAEIYDIGVAVDDDGACIGIYLPDGKEGYLLAISPI